ncbi:MAG: dienelactone hydrolase family protein [Deltaproteobacteria bacterium]|nr:dienelactone hydrolase family protein [Deltaproteobacteria bacterium]
MVQLGELRANVVGSGDTALVLMHGFGAPGDDLVVLSEMLDESRPAMRFVFPEAPISLDAFFGDSRAWWMIDVGRFERALRSGDVEVLIAEEPEGLVAARHKVLGLLDALERAHGIPSERVILGGFSQGGMLAIDTVLRSGRSFAGLVVLSGTLLAKSAWIEAAGRLRGFPVFQSHGTMDPILPYPIAEMLRESLVKAGLDVEFVPFPGSHEIPPRVLSKLRSFLGRLEVPRPR